jgi:hypothetical protein
MSRSLRIVLVVVMALGFIFGFAGLLLPGQTAMLETPRHGVHQFQRLHIFFFNLVAGGTILLWFAEGRRALSPRVAAYLALSLAFSIAAFLDNYGLSIVLALVLASVVESLRIQRYRFFPVDFFRPRSDLAEKFLHAALLCLSLGLLISAAVMVNNQYVHRFDFLNVLLDDFFLGFSFPLSLLTFSVVFATMRPPRDGLDRILREASFWIVNLGVIIFFGFIILDMPAAEMTMALFLLGTVLMIYYLFQCNSKELEQRTFFMSGMAFLAMTGVSGTLILLWDSYAGPGSGEGQNLILQIHGYLSLYGWNLVGLTVAVRFGELLLRLHKVAVVLLHWVTVALLAPLGTLRPAFAVFAIPTFVLLLCLFFFTRGRGPLASHGSSHTQHTA